MLLRDTTLNETFMKKELHYQKKRAHAEYGESKRTHRAYVHVPHACFFNSKSRELSIAEKLLLATLLLSIPCGERYEIDYLSHVSSDRHVKRYGA